MKLLDYIIGALVVGCFFIGYLGHRFVAILLLALILILASWRFWDYRRKQAMGRGCSGELNPEHDNWADLRPGHETSGGDAGGDD